LSNYCAEVNAIMKHSYPIRLAALFAASTLFSSPALIQAGGTDVSHFSSLTSFEAPAGAADTDAVGKISIRQNKQGHSEHQIMDILVRNLDASTDFELRLLTLDTTVDPPMAKWVKMEDFTTDAKGRAVLRFRTVVAGNSQAAAKKYKAFPDGLDSRSAVLGIFNKDGVDPILTADLSQPDKFQVLLKVGLTSAGQASGTLFVKGTNSKGSIRVALTNLTTPGNYTLFLNPTGAAGETGAQTVAADTNGRALFDVGLENPPDVLALEKIQVIQEGEPLPLITWELE
jgi:hypothetical protein